MAFREIQSTFSLGELDPILLARADFEGYYKGARRLRNVLVIPQGGVVRRFGLNYIATVIDTDDNAPITDSDEVNGIVYDFSAAKSFLIIARPHDRTGTPAVAFDIYLNNTLQTTVTTTDYTIAQIKDLYFETAKDRVLIFHESVQPKQLKRTNDTTWALSSIDFAYVPTFDFSIIDGTSYRGGSDTFTPSATSGVGITLTGSSAFFTQGHVGGVFFGGGGILRITAVNAGGTIATGDTVEDFNSTAAIKGVNAVLTEAAWGDSSGGTPAGKDRGWPSRAAFFQNRLCLAHSSSLTNVVWFSSSGDFFNFDDSEALDTSSFAIGVGSDGNEEIRDLVGAKALTVLGAIGIHSSSLFLENPITPSNAFLNQQDAIGSADLRAFHLDGQVFYVDDNLQRINTAAFDIASNSAVVSDASILSAHLIDTPVHTSTYKPSNNNGTFFMSVNDDGSMAIFQSLLNQSINAWTLSSTRGEFERIYSSKKNAWALCKRSLGTGSTTAGDIDNVYKGNVDFESYTDITAASQDGATDVDIFENESEYILLGHDSPFYRVAVAFNTAASDDIEPTFEYLNKYGTWSTFTPTSDGTSGFTSDGTIVWDLDTHTPNWAPLDIRKYLPQGSSLPVDTLVGHVEKFWVRIRRTAETVTTTPIEDTILINSAKRLYIEEFDFNEYTDSTQTTTSDSDNLVTGLDHLVAQQVYCLVDEIPEGPYYVDESGEITISEASSTDVRVGIDFTPSVIPMPLISRAFFAQNVYEPKHIKSVYVDYYNSLGVLVNGFEIPQLSLNNFVLDQTPIPATDFWEITPMRGWDVRAEIEISQELPLPMTIIGIGYRMEIS